MTDVCIMDRVENPVQTLGQMFFITPPILILHSLDFPILLTTFPAFYPLLRELSYYGGYFFLQISFGESEFS